MLISVDWRQDFNVVTDHIMCYTLSEGFTYSPAEQSRTNGFWRTARFGDLGLRDVHAMRIRLTGE